ncbi:MAG: succinyl-diaminopimelate desuccinylase [Gammaproteobacteria bacterium]|nr:succinyl-diaminopimelate desuccinylase [Gammaproteobacteria bacterium]NVK87349.1 succinyl-diaminopimelate desuccinylase [Gammaproteobacteria bacterium]
MTSEVLQLAQALIARPSVTPEDCGCQQLMIERLAPLGFNTEKMDFGDTENFWSLRAGQIPQAPVLIFAGHTDVVPAGNREKWHTDPFQPVVVDNRLYGRGAADMKGSLAAMIIATEHFLTQHPDCAGSLGFLITSDEEGPFINGTTKVVDTLMARQQRVDYAIVGEPSSRNKIGDVIKNGRRGSLTGWVTVHGQQGHVAYPHLANNAFHTALKALDELACRTWDNGNAAFPPTSLQITNAHAGTGAGNIIPGEFAFEFNFRYSTEQTATGLMQQVETLLQSYQLNYEINWKLNGEPFLTPEGPLLEACKAAIKQVTGRETQAETSGGTSDGRFIAKMGSQVVELGPCNATIHQVNECVDVAELETLVKLYQNILERTLLK